MSCGMDHVDVVSRRAGGIAMAGLVPDATLDLEFAFTGWLDSCRDLLSPTQCCRRARNHGGEHAAGFGTGRVRWDHPAEHHHPDRADHKHPPV